jgi:hypothetical protein
MHHPGSITTRHLTRSPIGLSGAITLQPNVTAADIANPPVGRRRDAADDGSRLG